MPDLQYKLLNIFSLISYNSDYYCFCEKYQDVKRILSWEGTSSHFVILGYIFVMTSRTLKNI